MMLVAAAAAAAIERIMNDFGCRYGRISRAAPSVAGREGMRQGTFCFGADTDTGGVWTLDRHAERGGRLAASRRASGLLVVW